MLDGKKGECMYGDEEELEGLTAIRLAGRYMVAMAVMILVERESRLDFWARSASMADWALATELMVLRDSAWTFKISAFR